MIIDGIDYSVSLFIENTAGESIDDFDFNDFEELNCFIRNNKYNPKYAEANFSYSLIEIVNGTTDAVSWTKTIAFEEFTEDQIQYEIEDYRKFVAETIEESICLDQYQKQIHFVGEDVDYRKKQSRLQEFAYICPNCLREVEDCRCDSYPYYLVQIDRLILPTIRELNKKGYKTTGCCAGHPDKDNPNFVGIYICFDQDYDFDEPIPDGGIYSKNKHSVHFNYECTDYEVLVQFQYDALDKLSDWVEMLSENMNSDDF